MAIKIDRRYKKRLAHNNMGGEVSWTMHPFHVGREDARIFSTPLSPSLWHNDTCCMFNDYLSERAGETMNE